MSYDNVEDYPPRAAVGTSRSLPSEPSLELPLRSMAKIGEDSARFEASVTPSTRHPLSALDLMSDGSEAGFEMTDEKGPMTA